MVAQNYSYTFTNLVYDNSTQTKTLGSVSWTLINDGNYYGFSSTKGQQIGSASNSASNMILETAAFSGLITQVKISTSGASGISANVSVKINGNSFGGAVQTISDSNQTYTFSGTAAGNLQIIWNQTSSKALYIKKIEIIIENAITSVGTGIQKNWSDANAWAGGIVPTAADNVIIGGNDVITLDQINYQTRNTGTSTIISTGATLATNIQYINNGDTRIEGNFQLNPGGYTNSGNNFVYGSTGGLIFNNSSFYAVNNTDQYWPENSGPVNVKILQGGLQLNTGVERSVSGTFETSAGVKILGKLNLNGICQLNPNGYFENSPNYGSVATLVYNSNYNVSNEWTGNGLPGLGLPANIIVKSGTVHLPNSNRGITGNLNIQNGAAFSLNNSAGDFYLGGNWENEGSFAANNRAVFFNGTTPQTIKNTNGESFSYLAHTGSATLTLLSDVKILADVGDVLNLSGGALDLNGHTLSLEGSGGNIQLTNPQNINSTVSGGVLKIAGAGPNSKYIYGALLNIGQNVICHLENGLDFGNQLTTINGILKISGLGYVPTNPPIYGPTSTLQYENFSAYTVGNEWNGGANSVAGNPQNVNLIASNLSFSTQDHYLKGNLNIDTASSFQLNGTAGDLYIAGNFTNNHVFNANNRAVFFNGSSAQMITGENTFDYFFLNNPAGVTLANSIIINKELNFSAGKLTLAGFNLTLGTSANLVNPDENKFVITNGTGKLIKQGLSSTAFNFAIGNSATSYAPLVLKTNSGTAEVAVNVSSTIDHAVFVNTKIVKLQWNVNVNGGPLDFEVTANWPLAAQASAFTNIGAGELGVYQNGDYIIFPVTLNGLSTFAASVSLQNGNNPIIVGDKDAILATNSRYFESNVINGSWANINSWLYSTDNVNFVAATFIPDSNAKGVLIRQGNTIKIDTSGVILRKIKVENGGVLALESNAGFSTAGAAGETALTIESGGIFMVNPTTIVNPQGNAVGLVKTGGSLVAGANFASGTSFTNAYVDANTGFFTFEDKSVFDWQNTKTTLKSSGSTNFFRLAQSGDLVIFRLTSPLTNYGSSSDNIFNASLEANSPISLAGAGNKIFVGGVSGNSTVTQNSGSGALILGNGTNLPKISGNVTFNLISAGLRLPNGAEIPTGSIVKLTAISENDSFNRAGGDLVVNGMLDITNMRITNTAPGSVIVNGTLKTSNSGGLFGVGAAITSGNLVLNDGSTIDYNALGNQQISSAPNYFNLSFSGSGTKSTQGSINVNTNGLVKISDNAIVDATSNLANTSSNDTGLTMEGGRLILRTGGTQPKMGGNYDLQAGVIEFAGTSNTSIRASSPIYNNIEISGSNVFAGTTANSGLTFKNGGIFTVKSGGVFKVTNEDGFSGGVKTAIKSTNNPAINLEIGSLVDYSGDNQTITHADLNNPIDADYQNLNISGTGVKTAETVKVKNITTIASSELLVKSTLDTDNPNAFYALEGVQISGTGQFHLGNNSNLIQNESAVNLGNILVDRDAKLAKLHYNYWSAPVSGQKLLANPGNSGTEFSPGTPNNKILQYNESRDTFSATSDPYFIIAKGYAIRGRETDNPDVSSFTAHTFSFSGMPNNGNLSTPLLGFKDSDHGFNLIGNPYPSNLDFDILFAENSSKMYKIAYFWTNNTFTPNQQGSSYSGANYAIYNGTGGIPASYQGGTAGPTPNNFVKTGQGFIIQMKSAGVLNFTNQMREASVGSFFNNKATQKDRFRLNLKSPSDINNTILIGYVEGASNELDADYDADLLIEGSDAIYSILGGHKLGIQGKALPFKTTDKIELGAVFFESGTYTLSLQNVEGIFTSQRIYIKDNLLNKTVNLSKENYQFQVVKGRDEHRFEIIYVADDYLQNSESTSKNLSVYYNHQDFVIKSPNIKIDTVDVFDFSGNKLDTKVINAFSCKVMAKDLVNGVYLLKIKCGNETVVKKVIKN